MRGSKGAVWPNGRLEGAPANTAMLSIRLEQREPTRNRQRFYAIIVKRKRKKETLILDFYEFFAGGGLAWFRVGVAFSPGRH